MANNINIVITAQDKASKPIRSIAGEMDGASGTADKFRKSLGVLGTAAAVAIGTQLSKAFDGARGAVTGFFKEGFAYNSAVEQATATLTAFMGGSKGVGDVLAYVKKEAADTQFSFAEMANAAATLTPVSKSSGKSLKDLIQQAEILAALNPAEGLTGAVFSLREALSGDWMSLMDRFNIPRTRINELKAQGVPAMEIISRTLGEMGINYDLVAKQGQTTAARFDTLKDKLSQMAGVATKPIFDRVSQELGKLSDFDFDSLGAKLSGVASGAVSAFDDFIPKAQAVAKQVGDYLNPKLENLWKITEQKLFPSLKKLWEKVLAPLAPVVGTVLVGAFGLLVDILSLTVDVASHIIDIFALIGPAADHIGGAISAAFGVAKDVFEKGVQGFVDGFVSVRDFFDGIPAFFASVWTRVTDGIATGVQAVGRWFLNLPQTISFALGFAAGWMLSFITSDIPRFVQAVGAWFASLPGAIASGLTNMWSSVVGWFDKTSTDAANTTSQLVGNVANWFQQLPSRLASAASDMWNGVKSGFSSFADSLGKWASQTVDAIVNFFLGLPGRISGAVSDAFNGATKNVNSFLNDVVNNLSSGFSAGRHASGTNYSQGGVAWVGEHGPEPVYLPQGASVTPAYRARNTSEGGGPSIGSLTYHIYNQTDLSRALRDLGFKLELA